MAKRYSKEFKSEAVALLGRPGMTVAQAAGDLGVAESQLYKWRKAVNSHGVSAFPGKGNLVSEDEEMRRLKRNGDHSSGLRTF